MRRPKLLVITRTFEPGRVGPRIVIDAYAQPVPVYRRRARAAVAADDQSRHIIWSYRRASQ
jgi:hypothetical protein